MRPGPGAIVVNGRFLRARPTGLQRVARSLTAAAIDDGLDADVIVPPGVDDPLATRTAWGPPGRLGDHVWEQVVLPVVAGRRLLVSLVNTAPLAARSGAVLVHDLAPLVGPQWFTPSMRAYGRLVVAAARRARVVMTVSAAVAEEVVAAGVPTGRVHVVRNAVDPRFRPSPPDEVAAVRARFGLARPYVLHIGWPDPRKGADVAVAAHRRALTREPHDLVLVGRPHPGFAPVPRPEGPTMRRLGYQTDTSLRALLTGAAAFVYPSWYEGFGLPPLEAASCGTPALASDLPAVREATGGCAVLLPAGDVDAWADAIVTALQGRITPGPVPSWTWADAATALRAALARA